MPDEVPGDWPAQAADTIVRLVGQVRDKTTGPVRTAARGIVYGVLAGVLGAVCGLLIAIAAVRFIDNYIVGEDNTWLAHLLVGLPFTLLGSILLFVKARSAREP
jgi:ABC-type Fe3+ transport system permease subunit